LGVEEEGTKEEMGNELESLEFSINREVYELRGSETARN